MMQHTRVLLDLAVWLEVDRSPVTCLIANKTRLLLGNLIGETRKMGDLSGMTEVTSKLHDLWEIAVFMYTSSLVRNKFFGESKELLKLLKRG